MNSNCPVEFVAADSNDSPFSGLHVPVPSKLSRVILVTSFRFRGACCVDIAAGLSVADRHGIQLLGRGIHFTLFFGIRHEAPLLSRPMQPSVHVSCLACVSFHFPPGLLSPNKLCGRRKDAIFGIRKNEKYSRLCLFLIPTQPRERMTQRHRMTA